MCVCVAHISANPKTDDAIEASKPQKFLIILIMITINAVISIAIILLSIDCYYFCNRNSFIPGRSSQRGQSEAAAAEISIDSSRHNI